MAKVNDDIQPCSFCVFISTGVLNYASPGMKITNWCWVPQQSSRVQQVSQKVIDGISSDVEKRYTKTKILHFTEKTTYTGKWRLH